MLKTHSWRTSKPGDGALRDRRLISQRSGTMGRPFRGHADELIISASQLAMRLLVTTSN